MKEIQFTKFPELEYSGRESMNTLVTNLTLCGRDVRCIMVTSCHAGEGKSMISANIARTLAQLGYNVTLVDADLRRSQMASQLGVVDNDPKKLGLVHYLAGMCEYGDALAQTDVPGMYAVTIGRAVMNSLSLLNNGRLTELIQHLLEDMDYVIVDAPPVGIIIDAVEIAQCCDGTLFVVKYNDVRRRELMEAKQQIERSNCPILGCVLNNVEVNSYSSKKYYYKNYYSKSYYNYRSGSSGGQSVEPTARKRAPLDNGKRSTNQ